MKKILISLMAALAVTVSLGAQDKPLRLGVAGLVHGHLGNVSWRLDKTKPEVVVCYGSTYDHLAAVRGEIDVLPQDLASIENNVIVNEILAAAVKSAKTGKPVKLR